MSLRFKMQKAKECSVIVKLLCYILTAGGILDQYFLATFLNVSGVELPLYAVWVVIGVLLLLVIILAVMLCVRK